MAETPDPIDVIAEALSRTTSAEVGGEPITDAYLPRGVAAIVAYALIEAGFQVSPIPTPTEGVYVDHWTDEWKPTAPAAMSSRQAAVEILGHIDWTAVIEELAMFEDMDPLVYYGLRSELFETKWLDGRWFMGGKIRSHLMAWATSRMTLKWWCRNEDHQAGDMIWFNDCSHGDDEESPCEWERCWALDGNPEDFLRLAMDLMRDGWESPTDHPIVDEATSRGSEELKDWKSSALKVLAEWDKVFDALGRPGELGASKAVSSLAEVERLIAAGLRTAALADDATRREVEVLIEAQAPHVCVHCKGTGWIDDDGWSYYGDGWTPGSKPRERRESDGLVPCGMCGDWHVYRDERTEPTMVVDGWSSEQESRATELLAAAYLGRND